MQLRGTKPLLIIGVALMLAGGAAFLMMKDIPAPREHTEQVLDNDKYLK